MVSRVSLTSIGILGFLALDLERDRGVDRAAHLVDGLVQVEALDGLAVDLGDDVVGEDAGAGGGRLVDRGDDLDEAVFHRDLDAEAAELAAGLHLHVAEALGIHVARMRIEGGQHAVDGRFDQLGLFGLLDVIRSDLLEDVAEKAELPVRIGRGGDRARARQKAGLRHHGRAAGADGRTENQKGQFAHYPRTFSLCDFAHQGPGSIEPPSFLNST